MSANGQSTSSGPPRRKYKVIESRLNVNFARRKSLAKNMKRKSISADEVKAIQLKMRTAAAALERENSDDHQSQHAAATASVAPPDTKIIAFTKKPTTIRASMPKTMASKRATVSRTAQRVQPAMKAARFVPSTPLSTATIPGASSTQFDAMMTTNMSSISFASLSHGSRGDSKLKASETVERAQSALATLKRLTLVEKNCEQEASILAKAAEISELVKERKREVESVQATLRSIKIALENESLVEEQASKLNQLLVFLKKAQPTFALLTDAVRQKSVRMLVSGVPDVAPLLAEQNFASQLRALSALATDARGVLDEFVKTQVLKLREFEQVRKRCVEKTQRCNVLLEKALRASLRQSMALIGERFRE